MTSEATTKWDRHSAVPMPAHEESIVDYLTELRVGSMIHREFAMGSGTPKLGVLHVETSIAPEIQEAYLNYLEWRELLDEPSRVPLLPTAVTIKATVDGDPIDLKPEFLHGVLADPSKKPGREEREVTEKIVFGALRKLPAHDAWIIHVRGPIPFARTSGWYEGEALGILVQPHEDKSYRPKPEGVRPKSATIKWYRGFPVNGIVQRAKIVFQAGDHSLEPLPPEMLTEDPDWLKKWNDNVPNATITDAISAAHAAYYNGSELSAEAKVRVKDLVDKELRFQDVREHKPDLEEATRPALQFLFGAGGAQRAWNNILAIFEDGIAYDASQQDFLLGPPPS